jgi:S-adenosylmethionine decarboxylase
MDYFEHFIRSDDGIYVGNHLIADLWGIYNHADGSMILDTFVNACTDAGASVLFSHCHPFGEGCGTTGVVVLSESHLSWHHYPEVNMISIDIFMCGIANPSRAMPRILEFWQPTCTDIKTLKRGCVEDHKLPFHLTPKAA